MKNPSIPSFAGLLVPLLCLFLQSAGAQRPREPWLFEGSLDGRPGMVFLALHKHLTLAYDRSGCSVFLAWNGGTVEEAGPAPAGTGPGYKAVGPVYQRRINPAPWSVKGPKGNVPVTVRLASAIVEGEQARIDYVLNLPGGAKIKVRETPEFDDHYGDNALFRTFEVTGIPAGTALRLEVGGRGMAETWGGGAMGQVIREGGRYFLLQELDGATPLKVTWSPQGNSGVVDEITKPKNP